MSDSTQTVSSRQPVRGRQFVGRALGEICAELYGLTAAQIGDALDAQQQEKGRGKRIGELLVEKKVLSEADMLAALAAQLDLPIMLELNADAVPDEVLRVVPIAFARQQRLLPLGRSDDDVVFVATSDPLNTAGLDELRLLLQAELEIAVVPTDVVLAAVNNAYDRVRAQAGAAVDALDDGASASEIAEEEVPDLLDAKDDDEAPIIRLVNSLFSQAVKERSSDIHIEPF
jgi:hypothetical protein